jgi:hypothetical protein
MIVICLVIAGVAKALMDRSAEGALPWDPMFWYKDASWRSKWFIGPGGFLEPSNWPTWFPAAIKPKYRERFLFSSTLFVGLTDGWHLMQLLFINSLFAASLTLLPLKTVLIGRLIFGVSFEIPYRLLKKGN